MADTANLDGSVFYDNTSQRVYYFNNAGVYALSLSSPSPTFLTNGLVAYYPFSGNANDAAGTNNGTVFGATLTADRFGQANRAYYFDGLSKITASDRALPLGNASRTFSLWVNCHTFATNRAYAIPFKYGNFGTGQGNWINVFTGSDGTGRPKGIVDFDFYNSWTLTTNLVGFNTWQHLVCSLENPASAKVYINGHLAGASFVSANTTSSGSMFIGASDTGSIIGEIDDFRIYNRALSASEVQLLYAFESGSSAPVITSQPVSQSVNQGNPVSFSVTATGTPLRYQWQFNSASISGATNASYSIASATTNDAGTYNVVVSNTGGSVTSSNAVLTVIPASSPPGFLTNGLVAYYPFNGNANDASGNGNNGTVHGAQLATDRFGNANSAYYFDGASNYISIADSPSLNPPMGIAVSAWIKGDWNVPVKTNAGIVTKWGADSAMKGQWELGETSSGTPLQPGFSALVMFGAAPPQTGLRAEYVTPVADGQWNHLLMTYDGAAIVLYKDGEVVASQVGGAGSLAVYAQAVEIGRTLHGYNGSDSYFPGAIDDVRIYNRALSTIEAQQLYLYESQTHWDGAFQLVAGSFSWSEAKADAESRGGHLATFGTQAKWDALVNEFGNSRVIVDAWAGGYQPAGSPEPAGNWTWITGEPWTFSAWWPGEPNNQNPDDYLIVCWGGNVGWSTARWNDAPSPPDSSLFSYVLELEPQSFLTNGLVAHYPLNGNANDASGNPNNGIPLNVTFSPDRFGVQGRAVHFSGALGTNSAIDCPTLDNLPYFPLSYSCWFLLDSNLVRNVDYPSGVYGEAIMTLVGREQSDANTGGAFCLLSSETWLLITNTLAYSYPNILTPGGFQPTTNAWYHAVTTIDNSNLMSLYINGSLHGTSVFNPANLPRIGPLPFRLGASSYNTQVYPSGNPSAPRYSWRGSIDDVRIYSRALSSNEVAQLYAFESGSPLPPSITRQPVSQSVSEGSPVSFSVTATGPNLSYQWQFRSVGISGATNASYSLASATTNNAGTYAVMVSNAGGSVTSSNAVLSVVPATSPPGFLTNGLVAYYLFNGNANDASGNGENGYMINTFGTTNRFGSPNTALYFNGTNASVAISNQFLDIGHDYTLSMWFCTFDAAWQFQELVNSRPNPAIDVMHNAALHGGDLYLDFSIGTGTDWLQPTQQHGPKQNYVAYQWYHIVAIKSGSSYSTFVDAVLDVSFARSPGSRLVGLQIGSTLYNYGDPWPATGVYGIMDDVRIYNRALSTNEVQQLYAYESTPPQSFLTNGLVAYYPFNGNANDASGNGSNGTMVGTDWRFSNDRFGGSQAALFLNTTSPPIHTFEGAYVSVPRSPALDFTGDFTFSLWVNNISQEVNTETSLISNGSDAAGRVCLTLKMSASVHHGNDGLGLSWGPTSPQDIAEMTPVQNSWRHLVAVRSGTNVVLFKDGAVLTNTVATGSPVNGSLIWLGRYQAGWLPFSLFGGIDDVRMYNRALSVTEVQQLYAFESGSSAPIITSQPVSQSVNQGSPASFSVIATGTGLSYQWRLNSASISGATNASYNIASATTNDAGTYNVVVSNTGGSVTSSNAVLTVIPATPLPGFLTNGLVSYYPFNGNANDASGHGNTGQITVGSFIPDRFGQTQSAFEIPGGPLGPAVLTSQLQSPGNVFSLSAWCKAPQGDTAFLIGFGDSQTGNNFNADRNLYIWTGGGVNFYLYPGYQVNLLATNVVADGGWHSVVATLSPAGMRIYVDGAIVASNPSVTSAQAYSGYWQIGSATVTADIDDVRIYNRALSDSEVQQLYAYESQTHDDGAFQMVAGNFSWSESRADAEARGGHLATFGSQAKWDAFVTQFKSRIVLDAWAGGYQPAGSPEPAGNWTWITGEPWTFSAWWPGEPNNAPGENSLHLCWGGMPSWIEARWNDAPGSSKFPYILEFHPQSFLTNGLVAYYPFNGNANDASGNGNNGTAANVTFATVSNRLAATFTGALDSCVTVPNSSSLSMTNAVTVSLWYNGFGNNSGPAGFLDKAWKQPVYHDWYYRSWFLFYTTGAGGTVDFQANGPALATGIGISHVNNNQWYHMVFIADGGRGLEQVYTNGVFGKESVFTPFTLSTGPFPLVIGSMVAQTDGAQTGFHGAINDVRIYNRALSASEVQQLYAFESGSPLVPIIISQPVSQSANQGSPVSFSVIATGTGLGYQWQWNSVNIPGATNANYSLANATTNNAGIYTVIVSNTGGSVTSSNAVLTVIPPFSTATGTATLFGIFVVGANITDGGSGYTNTPVVRFVGGGGSGAQAVAVVSNGMVTAISMLDAGYGYTNAPLFVIDPPFIAHPVLGIAPMSFLSFTNLTVGGSYQLQRSMGWYWADEPVSFTATGDSYTQMVAGVAVSGDYRLALNPVPAQAFATAQLFNGFVVGAAVTSGGSGYVTSPAVNLVGGGGTNATAVSHMSGGVVTAVSITDAGIGYTNAPTIQIAAPPAAAVSPTVRPVMRVDAGSLAPYSNYQIQFKLDLGEAWGNWNGGLFTPTDGMNSQYLFITNGAGFFRLQHEP